MVKKVEVHLHGREYCLALHSQMNHHVIRKTIVSVLVSRGLCKSRKKRGCFTDIPPFHSPRKQALSGFLLAQKMSSPLLLGSDRGSFGGLCLSVNSFPYCSVLVFHCVWLCSSGKQELQVPLNKSQAPWRPSLHNPIPTEHWKATANSTVTTFFEKSCAHKIN